MSEREGSTTVRPFGPIAVVGRACVLPGALSPEALFDAVRDGRILVDHAPEGAWGIDSGSLVEGCSSAPGTERVVSDRGGYVTGFDEIFDEAFFTERVEAPNRLDALTRWLLHCARGALAEAGVDEAPEKTGLVVGNLSYPSVEHTRWVQRHWLGEGEFAPHGTGSTSGSQSGDRTVDPRNRFSSGAPVHIVANAFGLRGDSFAIDAACASSLYALDIACRRLQDGAADLMLAGGVTRADPLFIHLGFTALQALSPTGQSRPFHKGADGLLPAEGAGLVALKRLDDAVRDGDGIFGVIRGIGLSNDGRQSGFLAPAWEGQVKAMESAYVSAGLSPSDIDFVECHATGTVRGDSVELDSLIRMWGDAPKPVIGSLKGNIGHPITASGVASLLKVLASFDAALYPPSPCDKPLDAIAESGFRLLSEAEPWPSEGPRRAAISNFGFGGNNAHLIVEEWTGEISDDLAALATQGGGGSDAATRESAVLVGEDDVVICAIGVIAGESVGLPDFVRRLMAPPDGTETRTDVVELAVAGLGFPPNDLRESLAQQTSILAVVDEALEQFGDVDPDRTGVYVGMGVDPEVARHGLRVRLRELTDGSIDGAAWLELNSASARTLTAPGVIGCMPNIPANRVHAWKDWRAPGFTVASEELSGIHGMGLAARALRKGDIDVAVVGASDFSHERAHLGAAAAVLPGDRQKPGDAAVALILMRARQASDEGRPVVSGVLVDAGRTDGGSVDGGRMDGEPAPGDVGTIDAGNAARSGTGAYSSEPLRLALVNESGPSPVTERFGHAHAASGLLHVAAGAVLAHLDAKADAAGGWPAPRPRDRPNALVSIRSFTERSEQVALRGASEPLGAISPVRAPCVRFFAAGSTAALAEAVAADREGRQGRARLALVGRTEEEIERSRSYAARELSADRAPSAPGVHFGQGDPDGDVAFCYTGAAAAYPGAARDLLLAFPEIGRRLCDRFSGTPDLAAQLYGEGIESFSPATQLTGSSFVCQAHTEFMRTVLGVAPQAAIGLSSGETNSLMAFGVWNDLDEMVAEIEASEMYANQLTAECRAAAAFWGLPEGELPDWRNYRIAAPREVVEEAVADEPRVYVTVVHHDEDVVIGGDAAGCARVVDAVGRNRAIDLGLDMVVHCEPLAPFEATWYRIHERETYSVPEVRFYTNATNASYVPTRESAAAAITRQAIEPIDFPKTILQAYDDGVRVFVEHGPRATVTGAVGRILAGRPHVAVALDPFEGAGLAAVAQTVAALWAAGVPMELAGYIQRLADLRAGALPRGRPAGTTLAFHAHPPDIVWPEPTDSAPAATSEPPTEIPSMSDTMDPDARPDLFTAASVMAPPPPSGFGYDLSAMFSSGGEAVEDGGGERAGGRRAVGAEAPVVAAPPALTRPAEVTAHSAPDSPFAAVARAHTVFLEEQAKTQEAFLALMFEPGLQAQPGGQGAVAAPSTHAAAPSTHAAARGTAAVAPPLAAASSSQGGPGRGASGPPSPVIEVSPPIDRTLLPDEPFLTREQLEVHAGGTISEIFGDLFKQQDCHARQVRMPEPPLLFAERALLIEGEPGSMKKGRVVTETDVHPGAWYLHSGRMAPGVVIESGQADLLLISWLGADFLNKGERVYRLLGCDLTFHGGLPAPGETLTYDIHVDGHARTGDVRLFFFHYDCYIGDRLLISVRNGQAGFFTTEELAGSGGVLWDAEDDEPAPDARMDPPFRLTTKRSFTTNEVAHWVAGDAYRCFGEGFELAASHTRTPNSPDGRLQLIDHVPEFDPTGGPWGRGYLRAEAHVTPDTWFYDGHFKNDPCMPGTLMADAATQALSFAMAAMGFTIRRDGWRFEPVAGEMARFLCRGQVIPDGPHMLEYEVFIEEVVGGDEPEIYAALLCKSDGFKVFQCRRFGMKLVPDYPLNTKREYLGGEIEPRLVGPPGSDVRGDYEALLACAWGKPSDAFGQMFEKFDGILKCPRLPSPPYHFMSSIVSVDVAPGSAVQGGTVVSTFDVDPDAWFFDEGQGHMPFAVLVEVLLQPCGWFASYLNFFADTPGDVAFRNLDGDDCVLHKPVGPGVGTMKLTTKLTRFVKAAGTSIVFFEVACEDDDGPIMTLTTDFGFFSPEVLEEQRGLTTSDEMRARKNAPSPTPEVSLSDGGGPLAKLPGMVTGKLRMIDRVTGFWPDAGEARLGRIRTAQEIHLDSWYFKAHFFEDPVQPGSLGLEALIQTARALAEMKGWLDGIENPVWEHPVVGTPISWRYRGQVVPTKKEVVTEVEAQAVDIVEGESMTLTVYGTQWADGLRIYEMPSFAVRVRSGGG